MTAARAEYERYEKEIEDRGLDKGLNQGRNEGLRIAVQDLCEAYGIPLTDAQQQVLATMDATQLQALRVHLKLYRAWPATR